MSESEIELRLNAPVSTNDDKNAGRIDRVILDPGTQRVTHIVVQKGLLLSRDIVVPLGALAGSTDRGVQLGVSADELEEMPDFVESSYVPFSDQLDETRAPGVSAWDDSVKVEPKMVLIPSTSAFVTPEANVYLPMLVEEHKNIPDRSAEIGEGTSVFAAGDHIGEVTEVRFHPQNGDLTAIVVRGPDKSWVFPAPQIESTDAFGVKLGLRLSQLDPFALDVR